MFRCCRYRREPPIASHNTPTVQSIKSTVQTFSTYDLIRGACTVDFRNIIRFIYISCTADVRINGTVDKNQAYSRHKDDGAVDIEATVQ